MRSRSIQGRAAVPLEQARHAGDIGYNRSLGDVATMKHAETCTIGMQEEESMPSDMDWFDAHPGTDWFWRPPTAAELVSGH